MANLDMRCGLADLDGDGSVAQALDRGPVDLVYLSIGHAQLMRWHERDLTREASPKGTPH